MKIGVYMGLPDGGAKRTMEAVTERLGKRHEITNWFTPKTNTWGNRIGRDLESIWLQQRKQKVLAEMIDSAKCDVILVTHDEHLQAPHLLRFLKTPTVFLCQEPTRVLFESWIEKQETITGLKLVYEKINRCLRKHLEITNARSATSIIANSHYSHESIKRAYGMESSVAHLGIDKAIYNFKKSKKQNVILVVGNNEPQKALDLAVYAVSKLPQYELWVACPRDNKMQPIKNLAKHVGVKMRYFVGKTSEEMAQIYRSATITLATAHLEPFGLSVIESMACGTPVVAVNEGGFRETVTQSAGELTNRDPEEIAKAIDRVMSNYEKYAKGAILRSESFDWDETSKKIEEQLTLTSRLGLLD